MLAQDVDARGNVVDDPVDAVHDVGAGPCAAGAHGPSVRLDLLEAEALDDPSEQPTLVSTLATPTPLSLCGLGSLLTSQTASKESAPGTSCLLASTSRDAPAKRWAIPFAPHRPRMR